MVEAIDIWRTANLLIQRHGGDAELIASGRIDDMIECGDPEGEATWKRVLAAIKDLQRGHVAEGERQH